MLSAPLSSSLSYLKWTRSFKALGNQSHMTWDFQMLEGIPLGTELLLTQLCEQFYFEMDFKEKVSYSGWQI